VRSTSAKKKVFEKIVRQYAAGDLLFKEGDEWDGLYCVQSGRISVFKTQKTETVDIPVELVQLGPGSLIGEMGLFEKVPREASVKALEPCEVLIISREMFEAQMNQVPAWIVNLFKLLTQRLRDANDKLVHQGEAGAKTPGAV